MIVPLVLRTSATAVQEYATSLNDATDLHSTNRGSSSNALEEVDLLKIRDNPTRTRRLSSRTPKILPIQESKGEHPPPLMKAIFRDDSL